jgi:hypothetical protein
MMGITTICTAIFHQVRTATLTRTNRWFTRMRTCPMHTIGTNIEALVGR